MVNLSDNWGRGNTHTIWVNGSLPKFGVGMGGKMFRGVSEMKDLPSLLSQTCYIVTVDSNQT